jgi:anti-sigma B factor antagonist
MPAPPLEARVRHQRGAAIIDLDGELDGSAREALESAYVEAERHERRVILLNFAGVSYINSAGIALLVALLARARAAQVRVLAVGLSDHYVEIFAITRLSDFMTLFPDEERAMSDIARR